MFDIRLRRFTDTGVKGRVLTGATDIVVTHVDSGTATLSFALPLGARDSTLFAPMLVGIEYSTGGLWEAPRNNLFICEQDDVDNADETDTIRFTGQGFVPWLLARNLLHWSSSAKNGERHWIQTPGTVGGSASPGYIMHGMLTEGQNRGWGVSPGPVVSWDFTGTNDSTGAAWSLAGANRWWTPWKLLTPLSKVLGAMSSAGYCEWWTEGLQLRMFRPGTGEDRTSTVKLGGKGFTSAPRKATFEDAFTNLTVVPSEARHWLYLENTGADARFGRLEASMTQSGVEDHDIATNMAQATLAGGKTIKQELSYEWTVTDGMPRPFLDFNIGDMVKVLAYRGHWEDHRVTHIQAHKDGDTVTVSATVGDKILNRQAKLATRVGAAQMGSEIPGGSGVALPQAPGPKSEEPKAPTGLTVDSNVGFFAADGTARAAVTLEWDAVTETVDGAQVDVDMYEVSHRRTADSVGSVFTVLDLSVVVDFWQSGVERQVMVRGRSTLGVWSEFSSEIAVTPAAPPVVTTPPTTPTLSVEYGVVKVAWDGELTSGPPAPGFASVFVERGPSNTGPWTQTGQALTTAGVLLDSAVDDMGDTVWYRLVAVDTLGRSSNPSTAASITVTSAILDAVEDAQADADAALAAAAAAVVTADGKSRIFHFTPTPIPAAAASVGSTASEVGTSLGGGNTQPLPSGAAAGDLVLAFVSHDNTGSTAITASTGWEVINPVTQGSNVLKTAIAVRVLTGTGGDNVLAVSGTLQDYTVGLVRIPAGEHGVTSAADLFVSSTSGASGNADPANLNPGVSAPYLWLTVAAIDATTGNTISAVPSGYGTALWNLTSASSTSSVVMSGAAKQATASSDNPGAFTNSSRPWIAYTVAVPPGPPTYTSPPPGDAQGDLLYVYNDAGRVVEVKVWNGSAWVEAQIVADSVLVPGSAGTIALADGAVTAPKISAGSVTAAKLAASAVEAEKIAAGAIDGFVITGANVRTAASGQRTQLDADGLKTFNASNTETSRITAATGGMLLSGSLRTSDSSSWAELVPTGISWMLNDLTTYPLVASIVSSPVDFAGSGQLLFTNGSTGSDFAFSIGPTLNTAGDVLNAYALDGLASTGAVYVDEDNPVGLVKRRPTAVSGGTFDLPSRVMSFSGASSVTLDGLFTAAYRRYQVMVSITSTSTASALQMRFRTSGSTNSTSNYWYSRNYNSGTTATSVPSTSETSFEIAGGSRTRHEVELTVTAPFEADVTGIKGLAESNNAAAATVTSTIGGRFQGTTSFDGISLFPSTGTFTGSVEVYALW